MVDSHIGPKIADQLRVLGRLLLPWRWDLAAAALITGLGAVPRLYKLSSVPVGINVDEANTGLRVSAILDRSWAGPYDPFHGAGQPAGTEFWTAAFLPVLGDDILTVRLSIAVLGIMAIPLAYILFRQVDGRTTAIIGSTLLALSGWHLVFSRLAIPPVGVTTSELLASIVLLWALRSRMLWAFPIAGAVLALGLYVYNGYVYFLVGIGVLLVGWLASQRLALRRGIAGMGLLVLGFVLVAIPMLSFMQEHSDVHPGYGRRVSLFNSAQYEEASGLLGRADVLLDNGRDFVNVLVFEGAQGMPILAPATSVLLGLGALYALTRWREPGIALALVMLLLIPLGRNPWHRTSQHRTTPCRRSHTIHRLARCAPSQRPVQSASTKETVSAGCRARSGAGGGRDGGCSKHDVLLSRVCGLTYKQGERRSFGSPPLRR